MEPAYLTPTWVHFDKRFGRPACGSAGYPLIKQGSISTYVLIAQDDLNTLGYRTGGLDGIFRSQNRRSGKKLSTFKRIRCRWNSRLQHMAFTSRRCSRNWKNKYDNRLNFAKKVKKYLTFTNKMCIMKIENE